MRETKTIITPIEKHEVVIYTYITGREKRALENAILVNKPSFNVDQQKIDGIDYGVIDKAQDLAWRTIVVSYDGKKDGDIVDGKTFSIVDAILDLRAGDHNFIVNEVNSVMKDKQFEEKKTT